MTINVKEIKSSSSGEIAESETYHLRYNMEKQYHDATSNFKYKISRIDI